MTLHEFLDKHNVSQNRAARMMGITQGHLSRVIRGEKPMSRDILRRFELVFCSRPDYLPDAVIVFTEYSNALDQALLSELAT